MPTLIAALIEPGGYVSLYKLLLLLAAFLAWIPLVNWVYLDCHAVRTNRQFWTGLVAGVGFAAIWLWLLIPVFFFGMAVFLVAFVASLMAYVMHRNARVADFERVLTKDYFKSLFVNSEKKVRKASRGLTLITANNNEAPLPPAKSPDAEGFAITCECLEDATWRRASNVSFIPQKDNYSVVYEIDGAPTRQPDRSREEVDTMARYIKHLADMDTEEKRKPQKGKFSVVKNNDFTKKSAWEAHSAGTTAGEQLRLVHTQDFCSRKIDTLGLNENQIESIRSLKNISQGLILISGTSQSGRTTTLYTLLGNHDPFLNNINTLEKKKAADLPNMTQNEYSMSDTGTTSYSKKLQSVFRRGPDIVGVEDCDDEMCAKLACVAAKDGKIVYATLEANSVIEAVGKYLKYVGDKNILADALECVINQRLARALCTDCRQAYKPNPSLFQKFNIPANEVETFYRPGEVEYDKHGKPVVCEKCQGTGFYGRMGLFETIRITDDLRKAIRNAAGISDIASAFRRSGMLYMQEQAIKKIANGTTSINEVIRNFSA